jgi:hypothetical protein
MGYHLSGSNARFQFTTPSWADWAGQKKSVNANRIPKLSSAVLSGHIFRGCGEGISCSGLVFLVGAAGDDPDRIVGQRSLQVLGLIPRRPHPDVALLVVLQDDRHGLRVDRFDDGIRRRGNPTPYVEQIRIAAGPCRIAPSADGARSRETLAPRRRRKTAPRPGVRRQAASGIGRYRVRAASSAAFPAAARWHPPVASALPA